MSNPKLTLQPGRDVNGHSAKRWKKPTVAARAADTSKAEIPVAAPLAPAPTYGDYQAPANAEDRAFERGVTDDITYLDGGGAILHVEDHATGLSSDSFIDTSSAETVRHDTWAVVNRLMDRIDRANARAAARAAAKS